MRQLVGDDSEAGLCVQLVEVLLRPIVHTEPAEDPSARNGQMENAYYQQSTCFNSTLIYFIISPTACLF